MSILNQGEHINHSMNIIDQFIFMMLMGLKVIDMELHTMMDMAITFIMEIMTTMSILIMIKKKKVILHQLLLVYRACLHVALYLLSAVFVEREG